MYYYIVNPAAGGRRFEGLESKIESSLKKLGISGEVAKTVDRDDAASLAAQAIDKGFKTIVAVGGDETINEVIRAVFKSRKPEVAVGLIPTGNTNKIADLLGIRSWRDGTRILAERRLQEFSLVRVNGRVFLTQATLYPSQNQDHKPTGLRVKLPLPTRRPPLDFSYKVEAEAGLRLRGRAAKIEVSNQKLVNGLDKNQLLVRVVYRPPRSGWFGRRRIAQATQIHVFQCLVQTREPVEASADGFSLSGQRFEFRLSRNKLRLITAPS